LHLAECRQTLAPGDLLVFFTDGVIEARAPETREQFGLQRLQRAVQEIVPSMPLSKGADLIRQHLNRFTATKELRDDVTVLLLRRNA
jgi:serine phosphatase RsbU (regulator of sigma subunit)